MFGQPHGVAPEPQTPEVEPTARAVSGCIEYPVAVGMPAGLVVCGRVVGKPLRLGTKQPPPQSEHPDVAHSVLAGGDEQKPFALGAQPGPAVALLAPRPKARPKARPKPRPKARPKLLAAKKAAAGSRRRATKRARRRLAVGAAYRRDWAAVLRHLGPTGSPLGAAEALLRARALRRLGRRKAERRALQIFLKYFPGALQAPLVRRRLEELAGPKQP